MRLLALPVAGFYSSHLDAEMSPLARIPILSEHDSALPDEARRYLDSIAGSRGRTVNIYRALANHPAAARAFSTFASTVYRGATTLAPRHAELAYLTATTANNCYY